jgi:hypothetical protein
MSKTLEDLGGCGSTVRYLWHEFETVVTFEDLEQLRCTLSSDKEIRRVLNNERPLEVVAEM